MRTYLVILMIAISGHTRAEYLLAQIQDPDGYSNLRESPNSQSKVLRKILLNDYLYVLKNDSSSWFQTKDMYGNKGYMHQSRVKFVNLVEVNGKQYPTQNIVIELKNYSLGKSGYGAVQVKVTKLKVKKSDNPQELGCHYYIESSQGKRAATVYEFHNPESMGGHDGIEVLDDYLKDHIVVLKRGDYNGRTIVICPSGQTFNLEGGTVSKTIDHTYFYSFWSCDIGYCGFTVFDYTQDLPIYRHQTEFEPLQMGKTLYIDLIYDKGMDLRTFDYESKSLVKPEQIYREADYNYWQDEATLSKNAFMFCID